MSNFPQLPNPCKVAESDFDPDIAELLAMIPKSELKMVYSDYAIFHVNKDGYIEDFNCTSDESCNRFFNNK